MSEQNTMVINGFLFTNEEEAAQARKEVEGIKYIKDKTDMDNPEMVLQIYNKMIQQKLFETAVGFAYLKDLQEYLISIPFVLNEDVLPIPVRHPILESSIRKKLRTPVKQRVKKQPAVRREKNIDYKKRFDITIFLALILAVSVVGMFFVSASSDNPNILNYENSLINKYEEWEHELNEREAAVQKQEQELGIEVNE